MHVHARNCKLVNGMVQGNLNVQKYRILNIVYRYVDASYLTSLIGSIDDFSVARRIIGFNIRINGFLYHHG